MRGEVVQVGWYCDHRDESPGKTSHVGVRFTKKGKQVVREDPTVSQSTHALDYWDSTLRPPCPRVEPTFVHRVAS